MRTKIIFALVFAVAGFTVGRASQPASSSKVYELRMYSAAPGKFDALNARFRDNTDRIFKRHNMKPVGYWLPTEGEKQGNTFIYILEHPSREDAQKNWDAFNADPEWQKVKAASEADGRLVLKVDRTFMAPTEYSPIK